MNLDTRPRTRGLTIIDPTTDPRWDTFVQARPDSDVFHTAAWARVLMETYGYEPRYHVVENSAGQLEAGWPCMLVASPLTGKRLVSLPFCDHCQPLVDSETDAEALLDALITDQGRLGAKTLEVRGWPRNGPSVPERLNPVPYYRLFETDLDPDPAVFWKRIDGDSRRCVRQARERNVSVRPAESLDDLDAFNALNLMLRRRHGMLPQPRRLFTSLYRNFIQPGNGRILLAEVEGQIVAGLLCITHRDKVYDKFAPSNPEFWSYRPNHLLLWESVEWSCRHGYKHYDLGRVGADATGLAVFKEQWAFVGRDLPYYYYPAPGGFNVTQPEGIKKRALDLFARYAPERVFVEAGERLYRHLG